MLNHLFPAASSAFGSCRGAKEHFSLTHGPWMDIILQQVKPAAATAQYVGKGLSGPTKQLGQAQTILQCMMVHVQSFAATLLHCITCVWVWGKRKGVWCLQVVQSCFLPSGSDGRTCWMDRLVHPASF